MLKYLILTLYNVSLMGSETTKLTGSIYTAAKHCGAARTNTTITKAAADSLGASHAPGTLLSTAL